MAQPKINLEQSFYEVKKYKSPILNWILSTDHKRIGLLYLYSIMTFFIVGALLGLAMKLELIAPGGKRLWRRKHTMLHSHSTGS